MRLFSLVPLLIVMTVCSSRGQGTANSLLTNGDFEGTGGWPDGKGISIEEEGGNHYLRLQSPEPGTQVQAYRKIPVSAGIQKLKLSFKVKYEDIKPGVQNWHTGRIVMHFLDAAGKALKPDPAAFVFKGDSNGWIEKSVELPVPEGAAALEFLPALFQVSQGTLELDDVVVVPVES
ncbi:hypothetical protein BH09VER1_BH09VER1_46570 [soil metagenome]